MNPYEILGISPSVTDEEVKKAYRQLSKKYHPDANIGNPNQELYTEKFKQVQNAYKTIMDQRKNGTSYQQSSYQSSSMQYQSVTTYLNNRRYSEAMTVLESISERTHQWYYYAAIAQRGLGNMSAALQFANTAYQMNPNQPEYQYLLQQLSFYSNSYTNTYRRYDMNPNGSVCLNDCCRLYCLIFSCMRCCR